MELVFAPPAPWCWMAAAAALVAAVLVLISLLLPSRRRALGRAAVARIGSAILLLVAAATLALAAWNPLLVRSREPERLHLAVVLDNSPSVLRARGGWLQVRE